MSAQRVATAIGLAALAALLVGVGLPSLLPPGPVAEIRIVVPTEEPEQPATPTEPVPPGRVDEPDDDEPDDDEPDDDDDPAAGDSPDGSPDDSPDDDGDDDGD